ncbi:MULTISPECIES: hypothetical protein [unclassified Pseudomonas]|uniref:hypothetical protein n=1 Tax=unclassified Pseudomonas TaxID=196821 RepID=UPI000BA3DDCC|nr:hypothetical protein [Pseudomonas sp. Irchel 3H3]
MSTLSEIAANHAKMAKELEQESTRLSERAPQVVGNLEITCTDEQPPMPLHLMAGAQDNTLGQAASY